MRAMDGEGRLRGMVSIGDVNAHSAGSQRTSGSFVTDEAGARAGQHTPLECAVWRYVDALRASDEYRSCAR